jgi:uncharacterized protein YodC (DUF2158 family)
MSDVQFQPGDSVQYKGAGPVMRVLVISDNLCYCEWIDEHNSLQRGTFATSNLSRADHSPNAARAG